MNTLVFYKKALRILIKTARDAGLSQEKLKKYFTADKKFNLLSEEIPFEKIFERMIGSMQNRNSMPNVIKLWNKDGSANAAHKEILCDFSPRLILEKYKDDQQLFAVFSARKLVRDDKHTVLFRQWCKAVISGARFMCEFNDSADLKKAFDAFQQNILTKAALPAFLAREIEGFGFALSCDFLKEIGYDYPKPDIHLNDIFVELTGCERKDYIVYKEILKAARQLKISAYKLDKILWLICSGKFYLDLDENGAGIKVPGRKDDLLAAIRSA